MVKTRITTAQKLAVAAALQYVETRPLNPEEFIKLIENLFLFYNKQTNG